MKPRNRFRAPHIFGTPLRYGVPLFMGFTFAITGLNSNAGDILRGGGGSSGRGQRNGSSATVPTPAATDAARANARDVLARTNHTNDALRAMQNAARQAAIKGSKSISGKPGKTSPLILPVVPNGLGKGGLQVSSSITTDPTKWTGAKAPVQTVSKGKTTVTIKQTESQALLNWDSFNVGKNTTLTFDQSKGGADTSKWIAFNKINDPSGDPSRILGSIKSDGQVYIINPNGIIFGGSSQVNTRSLTVSSLPINDNLVQRGILNNPDAQFLFSALSVPGGVDGTPNFNPTPPPTSGSYGDVIVEAGATLTSPAGSGGNGGRIMLVGPNVINNGTISTESGQTILAAGLQVAVAAHDGADPSLRGLDVWVGQVDENSGRSVNSGIIRTLTGSAWMTGSHVDQLGLIDSTTSVNLNGRIDLKASYGAVGNPNFDSTTEQGAGGPMFFNQFTGTVSLGESSATRILPDYLSDKTVPGTALPERSQINIEGLTIDFAKNSTLLAPNAEVAVRAGVWPYRDTDGNRTIFDSNGLVESGLTNFYSGSTQKFFFSEGSIHLANSAAINVAGSTDVFVPLSQSILDIQLRGPELADSPLQRDTDLRGATITVDIRKSGVYDGKYWIGTPLGDVTGLAGLIQRNAAQLTAVGGNINLQAGGSIIVSKGSSLDVSGGYFSHQGGLVKTSALISDGKLIAIENATPDKIYDGVFTGETTIVSDKWGVVDTTKTPFFEGTLEKSYSEGAAGGTLSLTAPSMELDGDLRGSTVVGERQRSTPPLSATLRIDFESDKRLDFSGSSFFIKNSPTPPDILFSNGKKNALTSQLVLSPKLVGDNAFGNLDIVNPDGAITVSSDVRLATNPAGSISFTGANISIFGTVESVGGKLSFNTYNISPTAATESSILNPAGSVPFPTPAADRGSFILGAGSVLTTAAPLVNDFTTGANLTSPTLIEGGAISINSYQADLEKGSLIDVSGGAYISSNGKITYGKGGIISVITGKDLALSGVIGGGLTLDSTLAGYSGISGGSLNIQASLIQIGGMTRDGVLHLSDDFFTKGGFTNFSITGIGAADPTSGSGTIETYIPAVSIAAGADIRPVADTLLAREDPDNDGGFILQRITDIQGIRTPVSISFSALGSDDPFTLDTLEARGDIFMGSGSRIVTDAGAGISFKGGTITLLGDLSAPGGSISVIGASAFPLTTSQRQSLTQALATVHLGSNASISTAGVSQFFPDVYGRRTGKIFSGGTISISGNILAESGSSLDVSGASGILDLDPRTLSNPQLSNTAGLGAAASLRLGVATRIDSNGGSIDLSGSQMLLCDSTLRGAAGGSTATGGSLSIFSGNFYQEGASRTSADLNLIVRQTGNAIINPDAAMGVGLALFDDSGNAYGNTGFFAVDRFAHGEFASLSLGGKYLSTASPIPYGGNVDFQGPIDIHASGSVRIAVGGVMRADDAVHISASYIAIGQNFRPPANPDDVFVPFQIDPALTSNEYNFTPTFGAGSLDFNAELIDVGTLSLQNIGHANLTANNGDIRGNGTLSIAGDLILKAAQVYPTTLSPFDIFAYDHDGIAGSVTITSAGSASAPLSAGGSLSIYSSSIVQSGVLRAPLGTIRLGWNGSDLDPSDEDIDSPQDAIAKGTIDCPITANLVMSDGSLTSVSAKGLKIPYGISPDGLTWIDPRGVNVTLSGLPRKQIFISGENVSMNSGAVVDLSGGGDLFSSRWVSGNGGSKDLLGSATGDWGSGVEYQPGDLVTYRGETWSARVRQSGNTPGANIFWSKVADSFAIVQDFDSKVYPYNPYNTGSNADALAGNPGNVSSQLKIGDTITLEAGSGLPAGTYTLLPRAYAVLDGAYLVTPLAGIGDGVVKTSEGAFYVSGYKTNAFNGPAETSNIRSRYEIASFKVIESRVTYSLNLANEFIDKTGDSQSRPADAGYAAFNGITTLNLDGSLVANSKGRGAMVDITSFSDITLTGGNGSTTATSGITLDTAVLNSWSVDSFLIGGIRSSETDGSILVDVQTQNLTLDNPGATFSGPEIILTSRGGLTLTDGSSLASLGSMKGVANPILLDGDGTLLRVSSDPTASVTRNGVTGSSSPLMTIGAAASITAPSVFLDSTYGTVLSSDAIIKGSRLTLGSGQISIVFSDASGVINGSEVENHLTLSGLALQNIQKADALTLHSYRSIDFYGTGSIGGPGLDSITFSSSGLRGYQQGDGQAVIHAKNVNFENTDISAIPSTPATTSGSLQVDAESIHLGMNQFAISGYQSVSLGASKGISFEGNGSFSTVGNLMTDTPQISGTKASNYTISAGGAVTIAHTGTDAPATGDLGASLVIQGTSIAANSDITLPSGQLTLRATDGPLQIGGDLSVDGTYRIFNDLVRYSNAGTILLESLNGDVSIVKGGSLSVSAASEGGNAGTVSISAPHGVFSNSGNLEGDASVGALGSIGGVGGNFVLDVGTLSDSGDSTLNAIATVLDNGGFKESRDFRIRSGDISIDNINRSHNFSLSADDGNIYLTGIIDASGTTGGSISLSARGDLTLASGSILSVAADHFDSAGKGGSILLEAGTQRAGQPNTTAMLELMEGSQIHLGVNDYVAGNYSDPGSSAFEGKFTGTLHLRAPRTEANNDLRIAAIQSSINGASSIIVEGFKVYTPAGGILNISQRNLIHTDAINFLGAAGSVSSNEMAIRNRLLDGSSGSLNPLIVLSPGVEMVNPTGDLVLGLANNSDFGTTNAEALTGADWDLSGFRYGSRGAPGVLTLRAAGDIIFNNTLSDGFTPIAANTVTLPQNGHSLMWLATLQTISDSLPVNTQSWSYRITAGADVNASGFRDVLSTSELNLSQPSKGSVIVGEFYSAIPNGSSFGLGAAIGTSGQTANSIKISSSTFNLGNRFEVVRTGTGDITVSAGRDVQLRNQFSTIYTAGVALPTPTTVYGENDFVIPVIPTFEGRHPDQDGGFGVTLGAIQQFTQPVWSMAGGNLSINAGANIGRYTLINGEISADSSRQMPNNWLYRRGYVDSSTGLFASDSGFNTPLPTQSIHDAAPSTTWWIDYSNFFEGVGALGGGNVSLSAGNDVTNVDAVTPTNARMPGRKPNPEFIPGSTTIPEFLNLPPDVSKMLELGGGDVTVTAGRNIDGGVYYVERGEGTLFAGGAITTNASRSPSLGILDGTSPLDPLTWLPTTLFVGKSHFDVTARGDVLIGPVSNPFLLPQGLNNKFWYKTAFNTFSTDSGANVISYGGNVTHRTAINLPDGASARPIIDAWFSVQNLFTGDNSAFNASNFQPWLRLAELDLSSYGSVFKLNAPNLRSTAFSGDIDLVGSWTLFPSVTGSLELAAAGDITGLQDTGPGNINGITNRVWTASSINISDASPFSIPSIVTPLAYQAVTGPSRDDQVQSLVDYLQTVNLSLNETGSSKGLAGTSAVKQALHSEKALHAGDLNPVLIYAQGGDITGLTLYSPKYTRISAGQDISDVAFYLQNVSATDISLVSAGRDLIPFNENTAIRTFAADINLGNVVGDVVRSTAAGTSTNALAGDIQINGPGVLEVLSGRNIDLGTGANFTDGTGTGITSIGNTRNPYLPFGGADLISLAGVSAMDGQGAALGLSMSDMDFSAFIAKYIKSDEDVSKSPYLKKIGIDGTFNKLTDEQQAIVALEKFYQILRDAGRNAPEEGNYDSGTEAIKTLFGKHRVPGEILTRAREIRSSTGGAISLATPGGGIALASTIFGNPLTPPGIVTEYGGSISTFTDADVDIGQARIFTLRGGDITMWSSNGNIAAGTSPRTVVTAPPTRVVIDISSADVQTDLGGLATGGGIGVLASVEGVKAGNVDLIAPEGFVDAGDAGIRVTGNLNIAAQVVLNSGNISAGGTSVGAAPAGVSAPSVSTIVSSQNNVASNTPVPRTDSNQEQRQPESLTDSLSVFTVEVVGYGGGDSEEDEEDDKKDKAL